MRAAAFARARAGEPDRREIDRRNPRAIVSFPHRGEPRAVSRAFGREAAFELTDEARCSLVVGFSVNQEGRPWTRRPSSPVSRFPVPALADMPDDIRTRLTAVREKNGFIPNVFLVLAHRPDEFRAFLAYHDALMDKPGNLTMAEREMIVVATSSINQCQYCVVAHGAILRIRAKDPLIADQVAVNYRKADITPRQKAMLDFAVKVCAAAYTVGEDDFATLAEHGFDQEDMWDMAAISSFFGMSNRLANVTNMRPNPEFYSLGR